jgi:PAS domain S-box-containing protein
MSLTSRSFKRFKSYAIAVGVGLAAVVLQRVRRLWAGDQAPFMFVLPAMVFVAVMLGRGPGFVVMAGGALNALLLAVSSGRWASRGGEEAAMLLAYLALGASITLYGSRLRITTARAAQAERRLSMAQEHTGVGVFELDFEAGKAFITPTLCEMLGQPVMDGPIELDRWLGALHPTQVDESRRILQEKVDRGERRYEREQRIERPDGDVLWVLNRVNLDLTRDGKLAQARGAAVDITQRKRLDESLRQAQAELRQQVHDLQRLQAFAQQLMMSRDDTQAPLQALLELVVELHDADHGLLWLADQLQPGFRVVAQTGFDETGAQQVLPTTEAASRCGAEPGRHGDVLDPIGCDAVVADHRAAAARCGFAAVQSTPLHASSGGIIGFISVLFKGAHDTDERETRLGEVLAATAAALIERDSARALAAVNERRFTVALESSLVPFTILSPVHDEAGKISDFEWAYLNSSAATALAVDATTAVGRRLGDMLPPTWKSSEMFDRYVGVVQRGQACDFEARSIAANQGGWLHVTASPLQGAVAVWFADITEHKRRQQDLLEADRRKDEFLATLAHELRNPLAPIRQAILVARSPASSVDQKQWGFDVVERQVRNMARLLDDLLDISRITRGTLKLHRSHAPLSAIVEAAIETSRPHVDAKKHRLVVDIPLAGCLLDIDALRMSQVVGNLLTNAAKYTDPGGVIRISAQLDADELAIRIADNGVGLSPDQFDRLFEMFAQMPASAGRSQGGLGIGLALSRGILELHGGRISVSSDGPGLGSEFTVHLPAACVGETTAAAPEPSAGATPSPGEIVKSRRVMVADDNVDAAESLAEMLRLDGHEVHVSYDGEQALAAFRQFEPDVALLDVGMPLMSGLDVARAIRSLPSGGGATLIAVTGWGQPHDQELALRAGFDHHATKPVSPAEIRTLIAAAGVEQAH